MATDEEHAAIEQQILDEMGPDTDLDPDDAPAADTPETGNPEDAAGDTPTDQADDDTPPEGTPDEGTGLTAGLTPEAVERAFKKVGRSFDTYGRVVESELAFTRDALKDCPMCFAGVRGYINVNDAGKYPDPLKNLILDFLGISTEREYKQADDIQTCPKCDGEGYLSTGSHVRTASTILCPTCQGYGCAPPPLGDKQAHPVPQPIVAPVTEQSAPLAQVDVDEFNEPRILPDGRPNPNFGKFPQHKVPVAPWGITAGLTAQHAT